MYNSENGNLQLSSFNQVKSMTRVSTGSAAVKPVLTPVWVNDPKSLTHIE